MTILDKIDQHTIECDLRAFTHWLDDVVDQVNYLTKIFEETKALAEDNKYRIVALENRMSAAEEDIASLKTRMDAAEEAIAELTGGGGTITEALNMVNSRVDMLYSWLPVPYGLIDARGWKFAMGTISVMSANDGTPSIDGPGLFTASYIKDNDLYFN